MAKVVVVGAGLAGLCAGVRLAAAGYEVEVLEGRNEIGGRSRSRVVDGVVVELGGQFMSRPHKRMRKLVADAGLHLQRTRLWAGMTRLRRESWATGRLESAAALRDLRALTRIALGSNSLGAVRASAVNDYKSCVQDGRSVREWLGTIGLVGPLRESAETLIGQTFGGANLDEISLLSFAELVGGEGKGFLFLLDGFGLTDYVVEGMGALCAWLADQLASVRLESAVVSVEQDANGVAVQTISGEVIEGDRVIVTVPATILDFISFSPQLPNAIRDANSAVQYGQATKIAAVVNRRGILRTTGFVGGSLVRQGWSAGDVLYGLTGPDGAASDLPALVEDLCDGFRVDPQDVAHVELVGWAHDPFCLGTYGHFLPGRFDGFRRSLPHYAGRVYVAGSERSTRPGFMEGAVESGEAAADAILRSA